MLRFVLSLLCACAAGSVAAQGWTDAAGRAAADETGVTGTALAEARGGAAIMELSGPRDPGEWGAVALRTPVGGPVGVGTHNADGTHLLLDCVGRDGVPTLYVGPLEDPPAQVVVRVVVSLSDGLLIFGQDLALEQVETGYLMGAIEPYLFWNLQDGGLFEIFLDADDPVTFRLIGSREVLEGERPCGTDTIFPGAYAGHPALVLTGRWDIEDRIVDLGEEPVLAFPARPPLAPEVLITCDHRLAFPSILPGAPPYTATLIVHSVDADPHQTEVQIVQGQTDLESPPLSEETVAALAAGAYLEITLVSGAADLLPVTLRLGLTGSAALDDLACPDPADAGPLDLTGSEAGWAQVDAASEGAGPQGQDSFLAARFLDDRAPPLFVDCAGRPFFEAASLPVELSGDGLRLTLSVDGEEAATADFSALRDFAWPADGVAALGQAILDGRSLRITDGAGFDVIYPLIGLQQALDGIDCGV